MHILKDIINQYNDEELQKQVDRYFNEIKEMKIDFSSNISFEDIYQNSKKRTVLFTEPKSIEEIALRYLKKRTDLVFNINYPNRRRAMGTIFSFFDSLNNMSDFTIYRCDFKDFFNSVSSKNIYDEYIINSKLKRYEKELYKNLVERYEKCYPGLPTSNALIEIVSRDFDKNVKANLFSYGMIFYYRYIDDIIIVFNKRIEEVTIETIIEKFIKKFFRSGEVKLNQNANKKAYLSKSDNLDKNIYYLGYAFYYDSQKNSFLYGISPDKILKYTKRLNHIIEDYKKNKNLELLRHRIRFFLSRVVLYNNYYEKFSKNVKWDVLGIVENYRELRPYIKKDRIDNNTKKFLESIILIQCGRILGRELPFFLKGSKLPDRYKISSSLIKNKSIVFHPYIGWSQSFLINEIKKIDPQFSIKKPYRELVKIYCGLLKVEQSK